MKRLRVRIPSPARAMARSGVHRRLHRFCICHDTNHQRKRKTSTPNKPYHRISTIYFCNFLHDIITVVFSSEYNRQRHTLVSVSISKNKTTKAAPLAQRPEKHNWTCLRFVIGRLRVRIPSLAPQKDTQWQNLQLIKLIPVTNSRI